jgi:hypothetical protein
MDSLSIRVDPTDLAFTAPPSIEQHVAQHMSVILTSLRRAVLGDGSTYLRHETGQRIGAHDGQPHPKAVLSRGDSAGLMQ